MMVLYFLYCIILKYITFVIIFFFLAIYEDPDESSDGNIHYTLFFVFTIYTYYVLNFYFSYFAGFSCYSSNIPS